MSLLHEFIEEPEYLHCKIFGTYDDIRESIEFFRQIILHSRCSGLTDILCDARDMKDYPNATEKVIYMSRIIDQHETYVEFGGKPLRIAFLGSAEVNQSYTPGLDVAASREFAAFSTSSLEAAVAWLLQPAPKMGSNLQKDKGNLGNGLAERARPGYTRPLSQQ